LTTRSSNRATAGDIVIVQHKLTMGRGFPVINSQDASPADATMWNVEGLDDGETWRNLRPGCCMLSWGSRDTRGNLRFVPF